MGFNAVMFTFVHCVCQSSELPVLKHGLFWTKIHSEPRNYGDQRKTALSPTSLHQFLDKLATLPNVLLMQISANWNTSNTVTHRTESHTVKRNLEEVLLPPPNLIEFSQNTVWGIRFTIMTTSFWLKNTSLVAQGALAHHHQNCRWGVLRVYPSVFGHSHQLLQDKFFYSSTPSMRKD